MILNKAAEREKFENVILFPDKIQLCMKCSNCFSSGQCSIHDDMTRIKEEILDADLIILGSGIYFQQISSEMKNFIDRLSYWAHTFELIGKKCIIVTTSGSNGNDVAEAYMKRVAASLGMQIIGTTSCHTLYPNELSASYLIDKRIDLIVNLIIDELNNRIPLYSLPFQEQLFLSMKKIYSEHKEFVFERKKWNQKGYFDAQSFKELLLKA